MREMQTAILDLTRAVHEQTKAFRDMRGVMLDCVRSHQPSVRDSGDYRETRRDDRQRERDRDMRTRNVLQDISNTAVEDRSREDYSQREEDRVRRNRRDERNDDWSQNENRFWKSRGTGRVDRQRGRRH